MNKIYYTVTWTIPPAPTYKTYKTYIDEEEPSIEDYTDAMALINKIKGQL